MAGRSMTHQRLNPGPGRGPLGPGTSPVSAKGPSTSSGWSGESGPGWKARPIRPRTVPPPGLPTLQTASSATRPPTRGTTPGFRPPPFNDLIIYQLHVGAGSPARGHKKQGRFLDVAERVPYLAGLGVNAVRVAPGRRVPQRQTASATNNVDFLLPGNGLRRRRRPRVADLPAAGERPPCRLRQGAAGGRAPLDTGGPAEGADRHLPTPSGSRCSSTWFYKPCRRLRRRAPDRVREPLLPRPLLPPDDQNNSLYFTDHDWVGKVVRVLRTRPRTAGVRQFPHRQTPSSG